MSDFVSSQFVHNRPISNILRYKFLREQVPSAFGSVSNIVHFSNRHSALLKLCVWFYCRLQHVAGAAHRV